MWQLSMKTLSHMLLGTEPPPDVVESLRIVLDARAMETGKAVSGQPRVGATSERDRDEALVRVREFLDELIRIRRTEPDDATDVLGMLTRAGQQGNDAKTDRQQLDLQIRDEVMSMLNASLDPTAAAMSWTLGLVAKHATVQARLRQEIQRGVSKHAEAAAGHAELPFAEMVVQEAMRLYPPNWLLIPRRCIQEATVGNYRIPIGTWVYVFPYVIHRDPRWFPDPESFDPDRFDAKKLQADRSTCLHPPGHGTSRLYWQSTGNDHPHVNPCAHTPGVPPRTPNRADGGRASRGHRHQARKRFAADGQAARDRLKATALRVRSRHVRGVSLFHPTEQIAQCVLQGNLAEFIVGFQ